MASPTMRSAAPALDTSPGAAITSRPSARSFAAVSVPRLSSGRWLSATLAPRRANSSTVASPMPDEPPVTSAALPLRSLMCRALRRRFALADPLHLRFGRRRLLRRCGLRLVAVDQVFRLDDAGPHQAVGIELKPAFAERVDRDALQHEAAEPLLGRS